MIGKFSRGPWRAERNTIRKHSLYEVRNGHRDPIAIVYTTQADAELMARSPRMLAVIKAILRASPYTKAYEVAIEDARTLVHELA